MLFIYLLIAWAQLRLRTRFEAEAPAALKLKMWFHPYGTWATMAAMIAVLVLMALSPGRQIELWASVLVTAGFAVGWWITKHRAGRTAS
jgi:GABA permease